MENLENTNRTALNSKEADRFDGEGNPRSNHGMDDGTMFYGSDKEYAEEMEARRNEAKN